MSKTTRVRHRTRSGNNATSRTEGTATSPTTNATGEQTRDYDVGYRKPPKNTQFKTGQSGNTKGRPKGSRNMKTDLEEELNEKITITESGKQRKLTKQKVMLKSLFAKAVKGDPRAINIVLGMADRYFSTPADAITSRAESTKTDGAILEAFKAEILTERDHET